MNRTEEHVFKWTLARFSGPRSATVHSVPIIAWCGSSAHAMCACAFDEDKSTHCEQPSHNPTPCKSPGEARLVCASAVRRGIQPFSLQTAGLGFVSQL